MVLFETIKNSMAHFEIKCKQMKVFAERIKFERVQRGWSQKKMAELLNIPRGTYHNYELTTKNGR